VRTYFPPHFDVELRVTIEGPSAEVIAALKRMGRTMHCDIRGSISAKVIDSGNRRRHETETFPEIENGDAVAATEKLDYLVRQRRVDAEVERELDNTIAEFRAISRRRQTPNQP
jgi:hypothetical protein